MKKKYKQTICFDIDNTICKTLNSDYHKSKPITKAIKKLIAYLMMDILLYFLLQDLWVGTMKTLIYLKSRDLI